MAAATFIPVHEYLQTTYRPDRDYIDGELKERNMGEQPHASVQAILAGMFRNHRLDWNIRVLTEQRVQTSPTRYRIPDVCVLHRSDPKDPIVTWAPLLCIEVLSEEDRLQELQTKVDEFAALGVANIWVIDPWKRIGYTASPQGFQKLAGDLFRIEGTSIELSLREVFAELDEA